MMRTTVSTGLVVLLGACTTVSGEEIRLAWTRALVQQDVEESIEISLASLSQSGVLGDIDCSQETGVDARQCAAFSTLMSSRLETLQREERKEMLADAADEIDALAVALTKLSEADFSVLQANAKLPPASNLIKPLSAEGQALINEPAGALRKSLAALDEKASDKAQELVVEVAAELMADPALQ